MKANIILVDWSRGSKSMNYVNAAQNTLLAANQIFKYDISMSVSCDDCNKRLYS